MVCMSRSLSFCLGLIFVDTWKLQRLVPDGAARARVQQFANDREAWEKLPAMLQRAKDGKWSDLPKLLPFQYGPALWLEILHVYFPEDVLVVLLLVRPGGVHASQRQPVHA